MSERSGRVPGRDGAGPGGSDDHAAADPGRDPVPVPARLAARRRAWRWRGEARPSWAEEPGPGEESVWDYPRPPAVEVDPRRVEVRSGPVRVAETGSALRVLETASPPVFYLPAEDVRTDLLRPSGRRTVCEWKGVARYLDLVTDSGRVEEAGWRYPDPRPEYAALRDHVAFHPSRVECRVAGRRAAPQPGGFYGGWVTPEIVGPFKGAAGTAHW